MANITPRIALVTGSSSGIGRATALALNRAGFRTIATSPHIERLDALEAAGCEALHLDLTDESSMVEAVETVEELHGPIQVLVNNAGYGQYGPIEEVPIEAVRRQFEVNVFGLIRMCQLVVPGMRRFGSGRIINVSSVAGEVSQPGAGLYHATKHAIEAISDTLRMELGPFNIDVVDIQPGPVATNFAETAIAHIPDTGLGSPYLIFKRNLVATTRDMLSFKRPDVLTADEVASAIVQAATARRPDTRYHVGLSSKVTSLLHTVLPDRVWDFAVSRLVPADRERAH
jgi:NAD(P)-dependent dehydrogenase (short-subunit alcohol dehydrogenase family)